MKEEIKDLKYFIETWGCQMNEVKKSFEMTYLLGLCLVNKFND